MKKRSRAGGELIKGRRRKTPEPKRRNAPSAVPRSKSSKSSPPGEETEVARLTRERDEALEQQTATGDVLKIISRPSFDLQAVLATLVKLAARLCEADLVAIHRPRDGTMQFAANFGLSQEWEEIINRAPIVPGRGTATGRVLLTGRAVQIADVEADPEYTFTEGQRAGGFRTVLAVPLEREGETIGVIVLCRTTVHPFTDKQISLVQNFAAQAVIAIENARLLNELRQRTTDLTERTADLTEALEQQTATSEVLQVISSSPGYLEPVFQAMLENATRICEAKFGVVFSFDGNEFHFEAQVGTPPELAEYNRAGPMPQPLPGSHLDRLRQTKRVSYTADYAAEGIPAPPVTLGGARSTVDVPMLKDNELVGAFSIYRQEVRPFTDKQIDLVKNFAAQAVIAIENARLLNELRQRTAELTVALEQQTATADVLKVISRSQFDLQLVLDNLIKTATSLCGAKRGVIFRRDGDLYRAAAFYNATPELIEFVRSHPIAPGRHTITARVALERRVIHVDDLQEDTEYTYALRDTEPIRTELGVPMFRGDDLVGVFILYKLKVDPFTDKQIDLVTTFADQAVIAIENVRLLNELRQRTGEVEKLNQHLEQRVADQVNEIERMSRLRRFLPPQVADLIVASGSEKQLESHRREITALFCDLRGFTGFTESADAEDVMALLRDYHAAIGEIIIKYNGTLERYAGDGVMVVFNDPVPVENPALQAVLMALELRDALGALTATWSRLGHEIGFGIGIAHGFATLGTIGFEGRFDYAAIGTVSNVASRLCDEAKPGQILISPRVLMKVENAVQVEPVGEFELKGIRRPLAAYNVVAVVS